MSEGRTIELYGQKYLVTAEMAEALEKHQKEFDEAKAKLSAPPPEPPKAPEAPAPVVDKSVADRIFTDPDAVLNEFGEKVVGRVMSEWEKREQQRQQETSAERERENFWADFVQRNTDLKGDLSLARMVLADEKEQFQKFVGKSDTASRNECIDLLADLTRKRIQAYIARQKEGSAPEQQSNHPFVEGATLKFGTEPPRKTDDEKPSSLTDIIKARQAARHKGKAA